jgi:hypothetical protein
MTTTIGGPDWIFRRSCGSGTGDIVEFVKKSPKMLPNPSFVKINTYEHNLPIHGENVTQKCGLLMYVCNFQKTSQSKQSPIG